MLFVSKFAAYRHIISPGSMRWVRNESGNERQVDNGDFFWAEFKLGGLDTHNQELALQEFRKLNPNNPLGAQPIMIDGTIGQMDAASEGETSNHHEGYMPYQRLSRFDTEDSNMCPGRWQSSTEECLLASSDYGRDFLRLDLLELIPPWPSYDEMDPAEIARFALAGKFRIEQVLRYEKGTLDRKEATLPLVAAQKRQEAEDAERAALTVSG